MIVATFAISLSSGTTITTLMVDPAPKVLRLVETLDSPANHGGFHMISPDFTRMFNDKNTSDFLEMSEIRILRSAISGVVAGNFRTPDRNGFEALRNWILLKKFAIKSDNIGSTAF